MTTEAEARKDAVLRDRYGNRMCYVNLHEADEHGVIVCMVVENMRGYRTMRGNDPLQAPWYYAHFDTYKDENGKLDMKAMNKAIEDSVNKRNEEIGISKKDRMDIMLSSISIR